MRRLLLILGVLCCATSAAKAGPNAGGVLVVHDMGEFCWSCTLPPIPTDCASVDNEAPLVPIPHQDPPDYSQQRMWNVYAVFPWGSSPRLKATGWRTQFEENTTPPYASYVNVMGGSVPDEDGAGTDFYIGDLGFPTTSGGQIGQSFPTGPRTTLVVYLFHFWGWGYNYDPATYPSPTWATVEHSAPGNRVFVDDASPSNEDPIMGYSSLGFGHPGTTACPDVPGACCDFATGACTITVQSACAFTWLGAGSLCNVATCFPPVPTERTSWGRIKNMHR